MTEENEIYTKRRLFPRFKVETYFRPSHPFAQKQQILDIGLGGMRVYGNKAPRVGKEMDIKLFLPNEKIIDVRVRIAWVNALPPGSEAPYDIGYEFVDLSPEMLKEIKAMLENAPSVEE